MTIAPTDVGFESKGCGRWTTDLSSITASRTAFDAGTYVVGTDITPGTYRSAGGDGCYWARLTGFGGTLPEIISNTNATGPTVVTIAAGDGGFKSSGCQPWTRNRIIEEPRRPLSVPSQRRTATLPSSAP